MANISGVIYVIVGLLVSGFSSYVESVNPEAKLGLFFYTGIIIIAIGAFKIIKKFIMRDEEPKEKKAAVQVPQSKAEIEKQKILSHLKQERKIIPCPACGTRHYETSNFCHLCGASLKNR